MILPVLLGEWWRERPSPPEPDPAQVAALASRLAADGRRRPGRHLAVLPVLLGGCGACGRELEAVFGPALEAERCRIVRVGFPSEADVLAITGLGTRAALGAIVRTRDAAPRGTVVVAVGDCAATGLFCGGLEGAGYAVGGNGVRTAIDVDLAIRGAPPSPAQILLGLATVLAALKRSA